MSQSLIAGMIGGAIMGYFCSQMAKRRGRSPKNWFFVGFFFGLFGLIAMLFIPLESKKEPEKKPDLLPPNLHDQLFYYLDTDKKPIGPMSYPALQEAHTQEKITTSTYIWNDTMPDWQKIDSITPPDLPPISTPPLPDHS